MFRSLLAVAATAAVASAAPPPEFALIPADAAGVVHVRLAELWANPAMADYRAVVARAGDKAVAALDAQFVPPPSTIERLTAVVRMGAGNGPPQVVVIARFSKPFDSAKVRAAYMPNAKSEAPGGKEMFADEGQKVAVHFPDAQTLVVSDRAGLADLLVAKPAAGGRLTEALAAVEGKPFAAVLNLKAVPLPPQMVNQVPPDFRPLLDAELMTLTLGLDGQPTVSARLVYGSAEQAIAADVAMKKGLQQVKPMLDQARGELEKLLYGEKPGGTRPLDDLPQAAMAVVGLGSLAEAEALLANPPVKRAGNALAADVVLPANATGTVSVTAIGVGLLLPAVQKVREAAARAQSQNNLKQIALALHNYESAHGTFPPAAVIDKKTGKRLLSWRVAILPYLEQDALYKKFKLDEPWDSPNNLQWSKVAIKVYTDPRGTVETPTHLTYYKALVGGGSAWDWEKGKKFTDFTDGTSNTLLVGTFGPPVPWAAPDDAAFDPQGQMPDLFTPPFNGLLAAFADGSVRFISPAVDPKFLKAIITASGGEDTSGLNR